jgi:hypothetical protein
MLRTFLTRKSKPSGSGSRAPMSIAIQMDASEVVLSSEHFRMHFSSNAPWATSPQQAEFAAWAFLPLAMALGRDLHIEGAGSETTASNAEKLSQIWSSWLPGTYNPVKVRFTEQSAHSSSDKPNAELLFFSGGIDSTYSLITREWKHGRPDLLTVQGMDYQYKDDQAFTKALIKTEAVAEAYASKRLFVKTDAYATYKSANLPPRLTFVFVLAATGFLFSENYRNLVLAADFSQYQQFEAFPYGSNFATNPLFASHNFSLLTHGDDVTRAEKLLPISLSRAALACISLCKNTKIRPDNCGTCIKCMRTKYMFLAATGMIPQECFLDPMIDPRQKLKFSNHEEPHDSFISATYNLARRSGNLDNIPRLVSDYFKSRQRD